MITSFASLNHRMIWIYFHWDKKALKPYMKIKEASRLFFFRLRAYLGQSNYLFKEPDRAVFLFNKVYRNYKLRSNHNMSRPLIQLFFPLTFNICAGIIYIYVPSWMKFADSCKQSVSWCIVCPVIFVLGSHTVVGQNALMTIFLKISDVTRFFFSSSVYTHSTCTLVNIYVSQKKLARS